MPRTVASTQGATNNRFCREFSAVYTDITKIANTCAIVARSPIGAIIWADFFRRTIKPGPLVVTMACIVDAHAVRTAIARAAEVCMNRHHVFAPYPHVATVANARRILARAMARTVRNWTQFNIAGQAPEPRLTCARSINLLRQKQQQQKNVRFTMRQSESSGSTSCRKLRVHQFSSAAHLTGPVS